MKFHSLMSLALLLLAFDSGAMLLHPEAFPAPQTKVSAVPADVPALEDGSPGDAAGARAYQNGDLGLDIQGTAGAEILRAVLAFFIHDAHAATATEAPSPANGASHAQEQVMVQAAEPAGHALPEPLSLSLLGMGFAVLGLTRRRGNGFAGLTPALRRHLFPWPALCWLD
ncbi:hypothetical protein [Massilia sp. BSC265]|uniref:hypothetical protein n=1 Tax=Massilia sp. BSC265 TaxID=1549812 RepID=UPI0004E86AAE|nr:hypothetical protein [Massilia sp. BSC265]KFI08463.1 hypothetical protein JN27_03650 [Massilia sp. BSC265]